MSEPFDVYIDYCAADREWTHALAGRLHERGIRSFVRDRDISPGRVTVQEIEDALAIARVAIVVVGALGSRPAEYSTLVNLADAGRLVLIPVLRHDGVVPPMVGAREPVSYVGVRNVADQHGCDSRLEAAVRGRAPVRPPTVAVAYDRISEGPIDATLTIHRDSVRLAHRDERWDTTSDVNGLADLHQLVAEYGAARRVDLRRHTASRDLTPEHRALPDAQARRIGRQLGRIFLGKPVGDALTALVALADRQNRSLCLALRVDWEPYADLPWETLTPPGADRPFVLMPRVLMYRSAEHGETTLPAIPGPLRILAVIASPDDGGGPLLDYEHELGAILDQVEDARRGDAHVRILNWGSLEAIRQALQHERFHVLHLSCHAEPGRLLLETADGRADKVDAPTFVDRVVIPEHGVPLIVLAGCSTAQSGRRRVRSLPVDNAEQAALPAFARTLLAYGVPAVVAMTAPVTDLYATALVARTYGLLSRASETADPLVTLSEARWTLEAERPALPPTDPHAWLAEWSTPAMFSRVRRPGLFSTKEPPGQVDRPRAVTLSDIADLDPGEFVGRRAELRRMLRDLRDGRSRGVLIHGVGGVGKSSLAVELVRLYADDDMTVVSARGRRDVNDIFRVLASALRTGALRTHRQLAGDLTSPDLDWRERLAVLDEHVLSPRLARIVLLLDDPAGDPVRDLSDSVRFDEIDLDTRADPELVEFIDAWLALKHGARLVVTARTTDSVPLRHNHRRLARHHLGPLSWAESQKMIWRLPGLYGLGREERGRAYADVGGHPRSLEYLDALLRSGRPEQPTGARAGRRPFDDIAERMEKVLRGRGIDSPDAWMPAAGRTVDDAVAEAVACISAEVLLDRLYVRLGGTFPLARDLFVAASVFSRPVDLAGLNWVVAGERPPDPARVRRLRDVYTKLTAWRKEDEHASLDDLPLPAAERAQLNRDLADGTIPPPRDGLEAARDRLLELSLLAPVGYGADMRYLVHRWTASSLAEYCDEDDLLQARLRAAEYLRWRGRLYVDEFDDLDEARRHYLVAGDDERMAGVAAELCARLHGAGEFEREQQVCRETIERLGDAEPRSRPFMHTLAVIDAWRGRYDEAERWQRRCIDLARAEGDLVGEAVGYQHLAAIAQRRNDPTAAVAAYEQATARCWDPAVRDNPAARAVVAACYQQRGALALMREDDDAWRWSEGALGIVDELADEADAQRVELDLARLAREAGDDAAADEHELRAYAIRSVDQDIPRLVAASELQLGTVRLVQGRPTDALEHFLCAVGVAEDVRDLPLVGQCLHLLGDVLFDVGDHAGAEQFYLRYMELCEDTEDRHGLVATLQQLGRIAGARGGDLLARQRFGEALTIARELGNTALEAGTLLLIAELDERAGDTATAQATLVEAMRAAEPTDAHAVWVVCAMRLAGLSAAAGDLAVAVELCQAARDRADRTNNRGTVVACSVALALLARQAGEADSTAVLRLRHAESVARESGDRRGIANCLLHLGRIRRDAGDHVEAGRYYRDALAGLDDDADSDLTAEVWRELGRVHVDRKAYGEAVPALENALERYSDHGHHDGRLWALLYLYRVRLQLGDDDTAATVELLTAELGSALPDSPLTIVALLAVAEEAFDRDDLGEAAARCVAGEAAARACGPTADMIRADALRVAAWIALHDDRAGEAVAFAEAAILIDRALGDRIALMHDLRLLGQIQQQRGETARAAALYRSSRAEAAALNGTEAEDAEEVARLLLGVLAGAASEQRLGAHARLDKVSRAWRNVRWQRRLRHIDGERSFTGTMATYLGPSVEEVLRSMRSRHPVTTAVAAVVQPHRPARASRPS